jgi:hypothetical protein
VNSHILGLRVAGTLFGLMALAQMLRLLIRPEVLVTGYKMPLWPSAIAVVVMGGMSLWMWKLARTPVR